MVSDKNENYKMDIGEGLLSSFQIWKEKLYLLIDPVFKLRQH